LVWYNSGIMFIPLSELEARRDKCFEQAIAGEEGSVDGNAGAWGNWEIYAVLVAELRTQEVRGQKAER
jgi:hypothetical protein